MATVLEFRSPVEVFPLGVLFERFPDVTVELERIVPLDQVYVPYFWIRGSDADDLESVLADREGLLAAQRVDSVDGEHLVRAAWDPGYRGLLRGLAEANVVILSAVGTSDGWEFAVRGEDHGAVAAFREFCQDNDLPVEITAVHALLPVEEDGYGLTATQREAMVLAYRRGYFDSPRTATLEEIAAELDITRQSLASRLRRGQRRLIGGTLADR